MRHYEIVVIARSEQKERSDSMTQRHQKIIVDGGGDVHRFEDWGVRPLAYPINKQFNARYFLYNVECEQDTLNALKESLRFSESIIRYLVVRCDKAETAESSMLRRIKSEEQAREESAADVSSGGRGRRERRAPSSESATKETAVELESSADEAVAAAGAEAAQTVETAHKDNQSAVAKKTTESTDESEKEAVMTSEDNASAAEGEEDEKTK